MATIKVDVVSAEENIFSGEAELVSLPGTSGELGIMPGHLPVITGIRPGFVRIHRPGQEEVEQVFVAGGILDVQPDVVTVLPIRPSEARISTNRRPRKRLPLPKRLARLLRAIWKSPRSKPKWLPWPQNSQQFASSSSSAKRSDSDDSPKDGVFPAELRLFFIRRSVAPRLRVDSRYD